MSSTAAAVNVSIQWRCNLPILVECQPTRTECRWGMPIFADCREKSVTIATFLERSQKEGHSDHAQPYMYLSWKVGEDRSSTFSDWSQRGPLNHENKESNVGKSHSPSACQRQPGGLNNNNYKAGPSPTCSSPGARKRDCVFLTYLQTG